MKSERTSKPVIGYLGTVDDRIDVDLIKYLSDIFPNSTIRFVGRILSERVFSELQQYENIEFTGPQAPEELPVLLRSFDIGLIPFVKSTFTKGIYPLKINEYLAAGLPVVLTEFADLEEFNDIASICSTHHHFAEAVRRELMADSFSRRERRQKEAEKNSWKSRVVELTTILEQVKDRA